jgi:hypothetical protein
MELQQAIFAIFGLPLFLFFMVEFIFFIERVGKN